MEVATSATVSKLQSEVTILSGDEAEYLYGMPSDSEGAYGDMALYPAMILAPRGSNHYNKTAAGGSYTWTGKSAKGYGKASKGGYGKGMPKKRCETEPPTVIHHHPPRETINDVGYPVRGGQTLLIAYFPWEASEKDVFLEMSKFATVKRVHLVVDKLNSRPRCFGFVKFASLDDAKHALAAAQQGKITLKDSRGHVWHLKAEWAKTGDMLDEVKPTKSKTAPSYKVRSHEWNTVGHGSTRPQSRKGGGRVADVAWGEAHGNGPERVFQLTSQQLMMLAQMRNNPLLAPVLQQQGGGQLGSSVSLGSQDAAHAGAGVAFANSGLAFVSGYDSRSSGEE